MNLMAHAMLFPGIYDNVLMPGWPVHRVGVVINVFPRAISAELKHAIPRIAPGDEAFFLELMFAFQFALRNLSNLGASKESAEIIERLCNIKYNELGEKTTLSDSVIVVITENPLQQEGKGVTAELSGNGTDSKLTLKYSGFGFMHWKVWPYIPNCTVAIFLAVAQRHAQNRGYVRRVYLAFREVVRLWQQQQVSATNHAELSFIYCYTIFGFPVEGELYDDHPDTAM
jgi:hypothetical protein